MVISHDQLRVRMTQNVRRRVLVNRAKRIRQQSKYGCTMYNTVHTNSVISPIKKIHLLPNSYNDL